MTALLYLLGVVVFVLAILASIGLHELGHMIPAKKFGGKVTQYFIGFGPTVWSKQERRDRVRRQGDPARRLRQDRRDAPAGRGASSPTRSTYDGDGNRVVTVRKSNTGMFTQLISDARAAEWETIGPEDADRLFYKMAWWKKVIVMAGGPTVNIADRVLHLPRPVRDLRQPAATSPSPASRSSTRSPTAWCRAAEDGRDVHADRPGQPRPRRPASSRATGSLSSTARRSPSWDQLQDLIRDNDDGQAVDRRRARRRRR